MLINNFLLKKTVSPIQYHGCIYNVTYEFGFYIFNIYVDLGI
jgi:hypothetical protein